MEDVTYALVKALNKVYIDPYNGPMPESWKEIFHATRGWPHVKRCPCCVNANACWSCAAPVASCECGARQ